MQYVYYNYILSLTDPSISKVLKQTSIILDGYICYLDFSPNQTVQLNQ